MLLIGLVACTSGSDTDHAETLEFAAKELCVVRVDCLEGDELYAAGAWIGLETLAGEEVSIPKASRAAIEEAIGRKIVWLESRSDLERATTDPEEPLVLTFSEPQVDGGSARLDIGWSRGPDVGEFATITYNFDGTEPSAPIITAVPES